MPTPGTTTYERIADARDRAIAALLSARNPDGCWTGELSSSALSTATAICALSVFSRNSPTPPSEVGALIDAGLAWLATNVNADGGWGDTDRSFSNISTTTLVWAAFGIVPGAAAKYRLVISRAEDWLRARAGGLSPARLASAIAAVYGKDRTFSIPILTTCAITGRFGSGKAAWQHVMQLPFELAVLPASWFGAIRLPVVSYALPALIAIGQVRHHFRPTRNPLTRMLRTASRPKTLHVLNRIQPPNGGFLEATPLTSFVTMSLAAMGLIDHPVVTRGIEFLIQSARSDGSWAIDTNLATWLTTLSVNALTSEGHPLSAQEAQRIRRWLLDQQYRSIHPYTNAAPGGWAWTDLPGGVPDSDDTAGTLLALHRLGSIDDETRRAAINGVQWLLDLQNGDGGIPTFCKGWGALPFDRSSQDITAHVLHAWVEWMDELPATQQQHLNRAIPRALGYLASKQRQDGAFIPLWFGHQEAPQDENPVYGTARVLTALQTTAHSGRWPEAARMTVAAERWLSTHQNPDGGWAGADGAQSSVEETALAVQALAGAVQQTESQRALADGVEWLVEKVESGEWRKATPIGFYFARLWYYEQLYPLIFTAGALSSAVKAAS